MPAMVISFMDGEVLHVEAPELTFELAILEAELRSVDPNGERAIFPVSAIRQLLIGDPRPAPPAERCCLGCAGRPVLRKAREHFVSFECVKRWAGAFAAACYGSASCEPASRRDRSGGGDSAVAERSIRQPPHRRVSGRRGDHRGF